DGNQPPLYFWLAWLVTGGTGGGPWQLRLPSLLASLLVLPCAWWRLQRMTGSWTAGLVAGYLLAINPFQIVYAQQARVYALVELLGLVHVTLFAATTLDARWWRRVLLVALTALLFYLRYTALLVLTGEVAWYLLARRWKVVGTFGRDASRGAESSEPREPHLAARSAASGPAAGP